LRGAGTRRELQARHERPTIYLDGGKDLDVVLGKVEKAGGKVTLKKMFLSNEAGYIGMFMDSEGNNIGLHNPK